MAIVLTVGGIDISTQVYLTQSNFVSNAGPTPGTCQILVKDESLAQAFTIGDRILLTIDGLNEWAGYLTKIRRTYPFPAFSPPSLRNFELLGSEISILFQRRIVYNLSDPTNGDSPEYQDVPDVTVLADLFDDYLSLSGDGIDVTTLVDNVGSIEGNPFHFSQPWATSMRILAAAVSPIWGINADRKLVWADVDKESAPVGISDNPGVGEIGCANLEILFDATEMINDALVIGSGGGDPTPVYVRELAPSSIETHGVWQMGMTAFGAWKQATVNKIANSWVHGSSTSRRGHKNDKVAASCTVWENGLRPGMVVHLVSGVWGWSDDIPIRQMRISWPAITVTRYDLVLSHELDTPLTLIDPTPIAKPPPTPGPKVIIVEGEPECSDDVCGRTDTFTRANGGWGGPNEAGLFWGGVTGAEQYVQIFDGVGRHGFNARTPQSGNSAETVAQFLPEVGSPPWEMVVTLGWSAVDSVNGLDSLQYLFGNSSAATPQTNSVSFSPDTGEVEATGWGLGEVETASGFDFSTPYRVRMLVTRSNIKVRLWRPAVVEPTSWNIDLDVTEITSTIGYLYWARAVKFFANGATYAQMYATIDDLNVRAGDAYYNRCTAGQFDNFQRVEASGWGTATPSGYLWVMPTTTATAGVDGDGGWILVPFAQSLDMSVVATGPWSPPTAFTFKARFTVTTGPTSGVAQLRFATGDDEASRVALTWSPDDSTLTVSGSPAP